MVTIYNIGITLYKWAIYIASFFNEKAQLWLNGRKNIFETIETAWQSKPVNFAPKKVVWIHVASLGEFEQGRPLIELLKNENKNYAIVLTFFSPSGYEIRKNYPLADYIFYLPIDTASNAHRFIDIIKPDIAIFVKYEFWYHYLNELKTRNIPTILISGIFNEQQFSRSNPYSFILKKMLACFSKLYVQNTPSVMWLERNGFNNVVLAGDTRIDRVLSIAQEAKTFEAIDVFVGHSPTLICGSTWSADEEVIIGLLKNTAFKGFKFIFAPHDISKSNVERLQKILPEKSIKYSECDAITEGVFFNDIRILVIDNIGMLSSIYKYGKIAYIGGGFGKGIHNTLEPIAFSLPVIFGPNHKKFEEAIRLVESGGGFSIHNYNDFEKIMIHLSDDVNYRKAAGAAHAYVSSNRGASQKIFQYIKDL